MIDVIDDIVKVLNSIDELKGKVYRRWPKKAVKMPAVLVSRIGGNPTLTESDGSEVIASLTYSIDINANTQEKADSLTAIVVDTLSQYNMHRAGTTDFYDEVLQVYRCILTFMVTVDKRGNTFTGGF